MANDVFSLQDNLVVEFYVPTAGNWIWGVSTWDGGDVWGDSTSSLLWTDLKCEIASVSLEHGVEIQQGVFPSPSNNRATIVMQSTDYDPFSHGTIHAGTPVRISIFPRPDTDPTWSPTIFEGTVEAFSSSYNAEGTSIVTLTCTDYMQAFLNTAVTSFVPSVPFPTPADIIEELVTTYWPASLGFTTCTEPDFWYMTPSTWSDTTVGQIIRDCLVAGQGAFYNSIDGYQAYLSAGDLKFLIEYAPNWDFSTIHSTAPEHICMYDLNINADSRELPTEIIAIFDSGLIMSIRNQDAYELYGSIALQTDVKLAGTTAGQLWLDNLNLTARMRRVQALSFKPIDRAGQLNLFVTGDQLFTVCSVVYDLGGLNISDVYFITKQIDTITPDGWLTTLELWRGI